MTIIANYVRALMVPPDNVEFVGGDGEDTSMVEMTRSSKARALKALTVVMEMAWSMKVTAVAVVLRSEARRCPVKPWEKFK